MEKEIFTIDDRELAGVAGGRYLGPTFVYVIQNGDTLPLLAHRFGTTVRVLRDLNELTDLGSVKPGTRLLIPQR